MKTPLLQPLPENPAPEALAAEVLRALRYRLGKDATVATAHDWLTASIEVVRDRIIDQWIKATKEAYEEKEKRVYYLSLEFLIGRLMRDAFSNVGVMETMRAALASLGVDLDLIAGLEPDAALGNGGLGRLAACFMESMATVDIPAHGYGIRYANGMFRQEIHDGWQVELPETWLDHGNPWEFERRERAFEVGFCGAVDAVAGEEGAERHVWRPGERVLAVAYDTPVVGWRARRVNTLRLWSGMPVDPILLDRFNAGDHIGALAESNKADALSRVLYPADSSQAGQELRLRQEYFFSSASLQDILQRHLSAYGDLVSLPDKAAIHLNDTHPAVAVPELMRLLIDVHGMDFDQAWDITRSTFAYTNHTLLPEALESWPVPLFERLLPRHMQLAYAINAAVLRQARDSGKFSDAEIARISLIEENGERRLRMGNLAFVGSYSINGVSALHTELMKETVFTDLNALYPGRINNKTNGITPRRWLFQCNPGLTALALFLLPYLDSDPRPERDVTGIWFRSRRGRRLAVWNVILGVGLTAALVVIDEYWLDLPALFSTLPTWISNGAIPVGAILLGLLIYDRLLGRRGATRSERNLALFTLLFVAFVTLTLIGVFFRGENMALVLPWNR